MVPPTRVRGAPFDHSYKISLSLRLSRTEYVRVTGSNSRLARRR